MNDIWVEFLSSRRIVCGQAEVSKLCCGTLGGATCHCDLKKFRKLYKQNSNVRSNLILSNLLNFCSYYILLNLKTFDALAESDVVPHLKINDMNIEWELVLIIQTIVLKSYCQECKVRDLNLIHFNRTYADKKMNTNY